MRQQYSQLKLSKKRSKTKSKKVKLSPKRSSTTKAALLALFVVGLFIFFSLLIQFFQSLQRPVSSELNFKKSYTWDGQSSINVAFKNSSKVYLVNLDPVHEKVIILSIPPDLYTEVPGGFGTWSVGSIYQLGESEQPKIGAKLVRSSLSSLLGLPVEGYIGSASEEDPQSLIAHMRSNPVAILGYLRSVQTNLTPVEAVKFLTSISHIRPDRLAALDLAESDITISKLLPDSTRVLGASEVALDSYIRDKMADAQITEERLDVAIFNATNHPGLAQQAARVVTNLGGNVIYVTNTENILDKSLVIAKGQSQTKTRLAQVFAPLCIKTDCTISDPRIESSRAQVNIVLGDDYYQATQKPQ